MFYVIANEALGHLVHLVSLSRHDFVPSLVCASHLLGDKVGVSTAHDVLYADLLCDA
jgi:hypothetical protein